MVSELISKENKVILACLPARRFRGEGIFGAAAEQRHQIRFCSINQRGKSLPPAPGSKQRARRQRRAGYEKPGCEQSTFFLSFCVAHGLLSHKANRQGEQLLLSAAFL